MFAASRGSRAVESFESVLGRGWVGTRAAAKGKAIRMRLKTFMTKVFAVVTHCQGSLVARRWQVKSKGSRGIEQPLKMWGPFKKDANYRCQMHRGPSKDTAGDST